MQIASKLGQSGNLLPANIRILHLFTLVVSLGACIDQPPEPHTPEPYTSLEALEPLPEPKLHQALLVFDAEEGRTAAVKELLETGEIHSETLGIALIVAAKNGHLSTVQLLLEAEAVSNSKDRNGITALGWAERMGHTEIVEALKPYTGQKEETDKSQPKA